MDASNVQRQHTINQCSETTDQSHFKPNQILRPREAAEYLCISERTLRNLMTSGEIPYSKHRRAVLIRVSDIEAFIDRHAKNGGAST